MKEAALEDEVKAIKHRIEREVSALAVRSTATMRAIRRSFNKELAERSPEFMLALALNMLGDDLYRWFGYELLANHPTAFQSLREADLEALGQGINSWWTVDSFARTLTGPAWLRGQVSDDLIRSWAVSEDRWWRRAGLVSTVALNVRSKGGYGDVPRTLAICHLLASDRDDMVEKALSWALRELVVHDPEAVQAFLDEHANVLGKRVRREVTNKIRTGLKY